MKTLKAFCSPLVNIFHLNFLKLLLTIHAWSKIQNESDNDCQLTQWTLNWFLGLIKFYEFFSFKTFATDDILLVNGVVNVSLKILKVLKRSNEISFQC